MPPPQPTNKPPTMKSLFALFAAVCAFAVFTPSAVQAGAFRLDVRIGSGGGYRGAHCYDGYGYGSRYGSGGGYYRQRYTSDYNRGGYSRGNSRHRHYSNHRSHSRHRAYAGHRYPSSHGHQTNYGHQYYSYGR